MSRRALAGVRRLARAAAFALAAAAASLPAFAPATAGAVRPMRSSEEYRLSWGVQASGADPAYRAGATGRGVTIAMIDTGVDPRERGRYADLVSVDLVADRKHDQGDRRHGERTAALAAGALDGRGTFGIAYDATLLSIRADADGSCARQCIFKPETLAAAVDYAVDHGARVIGMPIEAGKPIAGFEAALARAVAKGVVVVAAAGNHGGDEPNWPARYAEDPRFAPAILVVGATTAGGALARFSNRAGPAADRYLAAPGEKIIADCGPISCLAISGTSYAVPYVAGAVALLLSLYPSMSGPEAAQALLDAARPIDAAKAEAGRGRLDIAAALKAVGRAGRSA